MRSLLLSLLPLLTAPGIAGAAERTVAIGSVDRVRVDGPLRVTIVTGQAPALSIEGERRAIEALDVRADGSVLAIRARSDGGDVLPWSAEAAPIAVTVTTPALRSLVVVGGAAVTAGAMRGGDVDLSVSGTGTVAVEAVDGDRLSATLIGNGALSVGGGRVGTVRLVGNGGGTIDAAALDGGDLVAHLDGPGVLKARARYTAQVIDTGLGQVSIAGRPKCSVRAAAGGPVTCGDAD